MRASRYQNDSVQFSCSVVSNSLRLQGLQHARPPCPSPTPRAYSNSSIESVMPFNHLILCHPLLLLPSIFPNIRVSSNESVLRIRWPNFWSFSFSISPSSEYSGLISFRMDWFGGFFIIPLSLSPLHESYFNTCLLCVYVMRILKMYILSNFQTCNTIL